MIRVPNLRLKGLTAMNAAVRVGAALCLVLQTKETIYPINLNESSAQCTPFKALSRVRMIGGIRFGCHERMLRAPTPILISQVAERVWSAKPYEGILPVSRDTEPSEGAREQSSVILSMKRLYADLNCSLARFLASIEIPDQKCEHLLLNGFGGSPSPYVLNLFHIDPKTWSISRNIVH
jgi:hypothetical protein